MPDRRFDPLDELKPLLPIPEAWRRLGLPGEPGPRCRSPFREDLDPSFTIFGNDLWWKDQSTGDSGEVIKFISRACGINRGEAVRRFLAMIGRSHPHSHPTLPPTPTLPQRTAHSHDPRSRAGARPGPEANPHSASSNVPKPNAGSSAVSGGGVRGREGLRSPLHLPQLRTPTREEIHAIAASRGLHPDAVSCAVSHRTLFTAQVHGHACWVLTDPERHIAEARRIDRRPFPAMGFLGERKAHTIKGSSKSWPVGVAVLRDLPGFRAIMLVEGGPDYLAALHFLLAAEVHDVLPVAILGRSTGSRLDHEALALMSPRPVRIYPHADADGGGESAGCRWAAQLQAAGCKVSRFDCDRLARDDGSPVNDLNDLALCTRAATIAAAEPATLLP